jgi:hypothetical protein
MYHFPFRGLNQAPKSNICASRRLPTHLQVTVGLNHGESRPEVLVRKGLPTRHLTVTHRSNHASLVSSCDARTAIAPRL